MRSLKQTFILDSSKMFLSTGVSTLFNIIRSFIVPAVLGPSLLGLWSILTTISTYNLHADLGMVDGMNKLLPFLKTKGEFEEAERVKDATFTILCIVSSVIALILFTLSIWCSYKGKVEWTTGFRFVILIASAGIFFNFFTTYLRTEHKFSIISITNSLFSVFFVIFVIFLFKVFSAKLVAALIAMFFAYLVAIIVMLVAGKVKVRLYLSKDIYRKVIGAGFPLLLIGFGTMLFFSLDKWLIVATLGTENLGLYAIGISMSGLIFSSTSVVSYVLFPRLLERYGESEDPTSSKGMVYKSMMMLSIVLSFLCGVSAVLIPIILNFILPKYSSSVFLSVTLIFGIFFIAIGSIGGNALISIGKQRTVMKLLILASVVNVSMNYFLIKLGYGINGVAVGTGLSYFVYGGGNVIFGLQAGSDKIWNLFLRIFSIIIPYIISLLVVVLLFVCSSLDMVSNIMLIKSTIISILIYLVCFIIMMLFINRLSSVFQETIITIKSLCRMGRSSL